MTIASICTIGDEILIGQITDTNSGAIASRLNAIGVKVQTMTSVGDNRNAILNTLTQALANHDIVIVTGGLGPTKDDITKAALAELSGSTKYVENASQMAIVRRILSSRGLDMLDINKAQALVPETCEVMPNQLGTAPVMIFRFDSDRFGHKAVLYSLPGVPFEAIGALPGILEDIKREFRLSDITHKSVMTYGMAESALAKKIEEWEDSLPENLSLAYLPDTTKGVTLRLSAYGGSSESQKEQIDEAVRKLKPLLGDMIYSENGSNLQETIGTLLKEKGKTICTAESCTGGMISSMLTSVPGASSYFVGSVTSYSNEVKEKVLGVPAGIISEHGAVSSECVAAMAEGARKLMGCDFAVATSGIAGPTGGTEDKPVGLVWIGVSSEAGTETVSFKYSNDRKRNIERFAASALDTIRKKILFETNR